MNFNIKREKINEVVDLCLRFVSKSSTLPILENIYIKSDSEWITFRATDMEKYINFSLSLESESEWSITVNWKILSDIIRNLESDTINISKDDSNDTLYISSDNDKFEIKWIPSSEYVAVPEIDSSDSVWLNASDFQTWVSKVDYAITERNFSPVLTWLLIRANGSWSENTISFVWTDSFRLAEYKVYSTSELSSFDIIVPKVNISEIKKVTDYFISKWWEDFDLSFSDNLVSFDFKTDDFHIYITSVLIQWNFPDYNNENIMPTNFNTNFEIDKISLEKAIKKISVFTKDINNFIDIEINDWNINIDSGQTDKWQAKTTISTFIEWEDIEFWINWKYILDFIKEIDSDTININIVDNQKPVVFKDPNDDNITYIIRPLVK